MGFSLNEIGYPNNLDSEMAEDLIYLENCINEKREKDLKKNGRGF